MPAALTSFLPNRTDCPSWGSRYVHDRADRSGSAVPSEADARVAGALYTGVEKLPIVSPHGHTQANRLLRGLDAITEALRHR
ncbi:hypothetical protein [Mesorhizobium sp.]|uniref:hypothetical protein n=1 Tax=Mesorhizobium sp. TaxID=1871066 RepID=UPI000FD2E205|nr:hypothetical protein [Mesorhizobium sp.]RVC45970.1 hypothetical protein EN779_32300 [Mesorhizobium sp. M4B.F.Ca.ET.088.02.2.1]RWA64797.1 MAG: hypothetical protein EOQ27_05635 [Mesorhizobium sp.]RWF29970.1 MAG: hypothetical protein EOS45_16535 [Mesorhizobium sp.]RWF44009.1 MAG: hypothetical protein EOS65_03305 [Mesorhizobium sp.]TIX13116.1 MAG: hypothetical protein E5V41_22155 [Mesorhizobium sp.]